MENQNIQNQNIQNQNIQNQNIDIINDGVSNIYYDTTIIKKVVVEPKYLTTQVDDYILKILKKKYEGKCIHEGYIKEDSIEIEKKSVGLLYGSHFTGEITYTVIFKATVCNPVAGNIIEFVIKSKNPMCLGGILGPMEIVVPKEMVDNQAELKILNSYQIGDTIKVEVIKSRYFPNSTNIRVIGKLISGNKKSKNNMNENNFVSSYVGEYNQKIDDDEMPSNILNNVNVISDDESSGSEEEDESENESIENSDEDIELSDTESENDNDKEIIEVKNPNMDEEEEDQDSIDENYEEHEENISDDDGGDEF